jgi:outer membrane protein assembly factor BamB
MRYGITRGKNGAIVVSLAFALIVVAPELWASPAKSGPAPSENVTGERGGEASQTRSRQDPTPAADETEWPMFRGGPSLCGIAGGSLPQSPSLLWAFEAGDAIRSSAAVGYGKVYFGSDSGTVFAVDEETGKQVWSFETGDMVESSPCILDGTVFIGSADGYLYALDAATGELHWKYETGDRILGGINRTSSPDGKKTWILAGSYDTMLYCVDAEKGKVVWTYETGSYINGTPAVVDGLVIFGGCDAAIHVVPVADPGSAVRIDAGSYIAGSAAVRGPKVYVGHYGNELLCIDREERIIDWKYHDREFPFFSSPAVSSSRVVIGSRDKRLHCVDREDGTGVWTFPTGGKVDSSPAICGDRVVFGSDDGRLYIVRLSDGVREWSYEIGDSVTASPAVAGGKIFIGAEDGRMYVFGSGE